MVKMTSDAGTQTCETCDVSTQTDSRWEGECENILYASRDRAWIEYEAEPEPERSADPVEESERSNATDVETLPEYIRVMKATGEELDLEPGVYIHEGSELMSQLRDNLMMLPNLSDLTPECDISKADVGIPGRTTPAEEEQLRTVLRRHSKIFLGDGNAAPTPARGVVFDIDVGGAKPVALRPRSIIPKVEMKVYELVKKLLETGLVEMSDSAWASPIVIVLKQNGVDIRMCIDYRLVNSFIELSNYPLPLIDDLLMGFEQAMWVMSLDMASGFWAIPMTERGKRISAFVCPFGHFQWIRMPFGLKNAPLIYQEMINNCLWGFVRLPPEEKKTVDADVLKFLDKMTAFKRNIPAPSHMGPVLGRSSYIDDIAHEAPTWDKLCEDLNALLYRLCYWNISVSIPKSEFGKLTNPYLANEISAEGVRAMAKIAKSVQELPFSTTLKGVQSFLGNLNYYHKFIDDFSVVVAALHELTDEQINAGRDLSRAKESFEILKRKIVSTPLLRHPDRHKPFVIIPHANRWTACAVLGQKYDEKILPVRFTGRVLNETEIRYHEAEKEVIAIMRVLEVFENLVRGCPIKVHTRYSVLSWLLKSKSADGRCVRWGVILSNWDLEAHKVQSDEDGLAAIMGAGITPHFDGYVLSFDGAAKTSTRQGSCGCIIWKLPGWKVVTAQGFVLEDVTVNGAEYHGLLKGLTMVAERGIPDVVVVGDSRIVIQQVQGLINSNQPNLQRRLAEYGVLREKFKSVRLVHVKREYNQAADYLTSKTLVAGESWIVTDPAEMTHLEYVSSISEKLMKPVVVLDLDDPTRETPPGKSTSVRPGSESSPLPTPVRIMTAVTRSHTRGNPSQSDPMGPLEYQVERWRRIKTHQDEDHRLLNLKKFLRGGVDSFSRAQIRRLSKEADLFELDSRDVLFRLNHSAQRRPRDQTDMLRLAVPETLLQDILHYAHEDFQVRLGNTFLLLFQDMFSGYVMCKPMGSTTAQEVAEEERVFQRFGASSMIRHDQDPRFMGEVVRRFQELLGSKQRVTLGYRPKQVANKNAESQAGSSDHTNPEVESPVGSDQGSVGDAVWLYIPKVQPGLSRKLAHLWHGPFRIAEVTDDFRVRLTIDDTGYRVNPWVHISRLKPRALFPKRPTVRTEIDDEDDRDAALLPEDSWEVDNTNNEYEVEENLDLSWSKRTRTSKRIREYLVKWKGYDEPNWVPLAQLSCGALFNQGAKARARFQAMQAGDDHPRL
ncbi:reverse transcriptase [Phytophthora megakarya]|uniref:Reverse transcriptase n=1 Tax=Phytophthora megakarya TaxID=4795 RepID=A0A225VXV6_9STRA|nr:reverse transcriptase [Phytophthora megakarya]